MSISNTTRKAGPFPGDGVNAAFPFTYKVFQASDVLVVLTDLQGNESTQTLTSQYTVALNANQDSNPGGTVTMNSVPATGYLVTLGSQVPQTQNTTLTNTGGFFPTVINDMLDRVTILVQQLSEKATRSLTLPFSSGSSVSATLPVPSADKLLGWNSAANAMVNIDPAVIVGSQSFAAWRTDLFNGAGTPSQQITLTANPGSINNIDLIVGGVSQRATVDFTLVGQVITAVGTWPAGTNNVAARYGAAVPGATADLSNVTNTLDPAKITGSTSFGRTVLTAVNAAAAGLQAALGFTPAASGANNDITGLGALASVPSVVTTAINSKKLAQIVTFTTGAVATGSTLIPYDDTIPQNTEGDQYMSLAITPTNASSTLEIEVIAQGNGTGGSTYSAIGALFQDSTANALAVTSTAVASGASSQALIIKHVMAAGTTSSTTFKFRASSMSAGTYTFNGTASARLFGGASNSRITIKEYLP